MVTAVKRAFTFRLNLEKVQSDDGRYLYATQPFQPPRQPFKIYVCIYFHLERLSEATHIFSFQINGFDANGNQLQRLISTVIQSTQESPPEVFVEDKSLELSQFEAFSIKCHVESLSPVVIQWKQYNQVISNKSTE